MPSHEYPNISRKRHKFQESFSSKKEKLRENIRKKKLQEYFSIKRKTYFGQIPTYVSRFVSPKRNRIIQNQKSNKRIKHSSPSIKQGVSQFGNLQNQKKQINPGDHLFSYNNSDQKEYMQSQNAQNLPFFNQINQNQCQNNNFINSSLINPEYQQFNKNQYEDFSFMIRKPTQNLFNDFSFFFSSPRHLQISVINLLPQNYPQELVFQNPSDNMGNYFFPNILQNEKILEQPYHVNRFRETFAENQSKMEVEGQGFILKQNLNPQKQISSVRNGVDFKQEDKVLYQQKEIQKVKKEENRPKNAQISLFSKQKNEKVPLLYQNIALDVLKNQKKTKKIEQMKNIQQKREKINRRQKQVLKQEQKSKKIENLQIKNRSMPLQNGLKIIKTYKDFVIYEKVLGKGAFASVHSGSNTKTGEKVAVKQIETKKVKNLLQVTFLKQINHQNIISLYDYWIQEYEQKCYLFLQFCQQNLRQRLEKINSQIKIQKERLQIKINYAQQLIEGMNALNQKGFVHRDLKFENILVKDGTIIKICDFGLCRKLNKRLEIQSVRCGTPYTMAPEIYFHPRNSHFKAKYTQKADIFSLAVILHEFIYSFHPFDYEEDRLKKLKRIQIFKTQIMFKKFTEQYGLNIEWIEKIIQGGLKPVQDRLGWEEIMTIYRTGLQNQQKKQVINQNLQNKIKLDNKLKQREISYTKRNKKSSQKLNQIKTATKEDVNLKKNQKEQELIEEAKKIFKPKKKIDQQIIGVKNHDKVYIDQEKKVLHKKISTNPKQKDFSSIQIKKQRQIKPTLLQQQSKIFHRIVPQTIQVKAAQGKNESVEKKKSEKVSMKSVFILLLILSVGILFTQAFFLSQPLSNLNEIPVLSKS